MKETLFENIFNNTIFADAKTKIVEPRLIMRSNKGDSTMTLEVDLPGYNKDTISVITYHDSVIVKSKKEGHNGESIVTEDIGRPFIHEEVTGSIKDGVLTVNLPLRPDAGTVEINIT